MGAGSVGRGAFLTPKAPGSFSFPPHSPVVPQTVLLKGSKIHYPKITYGYSDILVILTCFFKKPQTQVKF